MRIRLDIAYDGTHFRGWALQPGLRTVQGTIEGAVARILGGSPRLVVAGRTDAGVHATGQVAHLDLDDAQVARLRSRRGPRESGVRADIGSTSRQLADAREVSARPTDIGSTVAEPAGAVEDHGDERVAALAGRIAGVLGQYPDVVVHRTTEAPEGFDARFSATSRSYQYRIADQVTGYAPLERHRTTSVRARLDVEGMDAAARSLTGLHDFAAYCKPRDEATTIRTLLEFTWRRDDSGILLAHVKADAFCHSMVRALVGACVAVGEGRLAVDDVVELRDELVRTSEFKVLAARGLTLTQVGYPADDLLAARAAQTRARRDAEEK